MLDTATRLSMLQERYKSGTMKIFIESLNDALESVSGKLIGMESHEDARRLIAIKAHIEKEINTLYGKLVEPIQEDMKDFAELEYESMHGALNGATKLGIAFAGLPKDTILEVIKLDTVMTMGDRAYTIRELFDNAKTSQINDYKQIISAGLASNSGYSSIVKKLKDANAKATTNMFAIVHTSISKARDEADKKAYDEFDDVITGWESVSVLDSRTSLQCASLDGRMYYKKKGYPRYEDIPNRPPRHFRCRSRLVPRTDFKTNATRAENGESSGQISAKTKFEEWFGNQSENFKREYLGKGRYELYSAGVLKIKDFVDIKTGATFTMAELRDKFIKAEVATPTPPPPKPKPKAKEVEFKPVKTVAEGEARLRALGVPSVKLQGLKGTLLNTVVKAFEDEHRIAPIKLKSITTYQQKRGALATYSDYRKEVSINKQFLKPEDITVEKLLPFHEQIKELDQKVKKWSEEYLDNHRYDQHRVKRTIRAFRNKILELEVKIKLGESPIQWTVGSTLETLEEQLRATVVHEVGHHRHYEYFGASQDFNFSKPNSISVYGRTNHKEYFAEWYTQYRLYGEDGIPEDMLELFREVK